MHRVPTKTLQRTLILTYLLQLAKSRLHNNLFPVANYRSWQSILIEQNLLIDPIRLKKKKKKKKKNQNSSPNLKTLISESIEFYLQCNPVSLQCSAVP